MTIKEFTVAEFAAYVLRMNCSELEYFLANDTFIIVPDKE